VAHAYDVVMESQAGLRRVLPYTSVEQLEPGSVVRLDGRFWLVAEVAPGPATEHLGGQDAHHRVAGHVLAKPARYRFRMRHPDGREDLGAFRRYRAGAPGLGHAFTTFEDRRPESWQVVDERLARDDRGEPYVELVAERDFAEAEELPDHELEHALERVPAEAAATFERATDAGLAVELVALEPGEAPDWDEAGRFIAALVLEELGEDILALAGVDADSAARDTWLGRVQDRLRDDLARFRADIEADHDQIEEWDYLDGRIFASVGSTEDEADPDAGHGWLCRLVDAGVLGAAGFSRVRKAEIVT
jgi:hypothetical protein